MKKQDIKFVEIDNSNINTLYNLNLQLATEENQRELFTASRDSYSNAFLSENPISLGFLAYEENVTIGFGIYYFKFASYMGSKVLYIEDIYLINKFRTSAYKTCLLKHAIQKARIQSCVRIEMRVLKNFNIGYDIIAESGFREIEKWDVFRYEL